MRSSGVTQRCAIGKCPRQRFAEQLMCKSCWSRVPSKLQIAVYRTWRSRQADPRNPEKVSAHEQAKLAAIRAVSE